MLSPAWIYYGFGCTRSFSQFPSWEKGKHGLIPMVYMNEKGVGSFPLNIHCVTWESGLISLFGISNVGKFRWFQVFCYWLGFLLLESLGDSK